MSPLLWEPPRWDVWEREERLTAAFLAGHLPGKLYAWLWLTLQVQSKTWRWN